MTPQGLGGSIRRLESEVGVPLFDNTTGHFRLTAYGRVFAQTAEEVEKSLRAMRFSIKALENHERHIVKLGCSIGLLGYLGEDVVDGFNAQEETVQVIVTDELPDLLCERRLLDGEYDFGLLTNPVTNPALAVVPLVEDYQFFWINRRDPLSRRELLEPIDLNGRTVFSINDEYRGTAAFLKLCDQAGASVDVRFTGEMMRVYEQARLGRGLGLTCRNHIEATSDSSVTVGVAFPSLPWGFAICYRKGEALSDEKARFLAYMRRQGRSYRA